MNQIELKALAKINLGLDVLGRRENGYHDVRMVMQSIYLYDEVKIERTASSEIKVASNLNFLPTGDGNIAYKAAKLLKDVKHFQVVKCLIFKAYKLLGSRKCETRCQCYQFKSAITDLFSTLSSYIYIYSCGFLHD